MKKITPKKATSKKAPKKALKEEALTQALKKATLKEAPKAKEAKKALTKAPKKALKEAKKALTKAPKKALKEAPKALKKAPKAERTYTTSFSSKDFSKELFSEPLTEAGIEYYNARVDLILKIREKLAENPDFSEILAEIAEIEDVDELCSFLQDWSVGRKACRVIMQLVTPVLCVCCADSERIAIECYDIARSNSLMGSCHNSYMVSKWDKEGALPFERTCCNFSTISSDINKAVELCSYWFYNLNR